jgi:hypothetical protein
MVNRKSGGSAMTSEARIAANRRNAVKSTGPKTTIGKAIVAQNAIKHGLFARQNVILGEDPQEFELHRRGVFGELAPAGVMASILAERIVGLTWRLRRAERLANEAFDYLLAKELADSMSDFYEELSPEDEAKLKGNPRKDPRLAIGRVVERDCRQERVMERLMTYEHRIESSLYRTMNELEKLRLGRKAEEGGQCPSGESEPVDEGRDCAKQSQSQEVSSLKCEVSSHMADAPACETKPIDPAGIVCIVPAKASEETPCGCTGGFQTRPYEGGLSCETKPISG